MQTRAVLAAKKLLAELGIDDTSNIDIRDLIIYHDGIVKEKSMGHCDGRTTIKNGRAIVSLNADIEFPQRKRHVLGHELGHIILHPDRYATFTDDDSTLEGYQKGPQEVEANDFSSELLMPEPIFTDFCHNKKFSPGFVKELGERFNISLTSAIYRYIALGQHPICAFYSKAGRVQYFKKSEELHLWIPDRNKLNVPSDSVANEFYEKGTIYKKAESAQEIVKSTWFDLGKYDRDTSMFEYCIVTPKYNTVLSVVWES